jgi:formate-dependent nitrite reductase membrane component NrfD/ferredoxin
VDICPVEALQKRDDGIVDFDSRRCIGCKACSQACPYNALYIDPDTHTSAKCNFCAHRKVQGYKPACEVICPQEAIISGDLDNPESQISKLVSTEQTLTRKAEKGTSPNVYYIDGDGQTLNPLNVPSDESYLWSQQSRGVGHFAKKPHNGKALKNGHSTQKRTHQTSVNVYDTPSKGAVWGWEVPAYILTKGISSGMVLTLFILTSMFSITLAPAVEWSVIGLALVFLALTGVFLVKDLDRPDRFSFVMFRPQFKSWLVKGGFAITGYGAFLAFWGASKYLELAWLEPIMVWGSCISAVVIAIYTAFLFGSAKGRDFWQSPLLAFHMFVTSLVIGGSSLLMVLALLGLNAEASAIIKWGLIGGLLLNLISISLEVFSKHPTKQAEETTKSILDGEFKLDFWFGSLLLGHLVPIILLLSFSNLAMLFLASILILLGAWVTENIWVKAPQMVSLS